MGKDNITNKAYMLIGQQSMDLPYRCVCVLPVNEGTDRNQQVNRGIPLQWLDLFCQGNLKGRKVINGPQREIECSH